MNKIQAPFIIKKKKCSKLGKEGNSLNLITSIYQKNSTASIILHDERLNAFLLKSGTKKGYLFSLPLFNILLEVLPPAIRHGWMDKQEKGEEGEKKKDRERKGEKKEKKKRNRSERKK